MAGPMFSGAEVLGDSMMLRFSLRHADAVPQFHGYPRSWGMCRSGKTAKELLVEEWPNNRDSGKRQRCLIMIGTNDIIKISRNVEQLANQKWRLKQIMRKIGDKAVRKYNRVLFCTIPEVPQLAEDHLEATRARYNSLLSSVNEEIMALREKKESITPIDLGGKFSRDCYERCMGRKGNLRPDNIHLNNRGQDALRDIVREALNLFSYD